MDGAMLLLTGKWRLLNSPEKEQRILYSFCRICHDLLPANLDLTDVTALRSFYVPLGPVTELKQHSRVGLPVSRQ